MRNKLNKYLKKGLAIKSLLAAFSLVVVLILIFALAQPALASDPGTTSVSTTTAARGGREIVTSSNGTLVAVFQAGTQSPTGIAYSTSTDGGTTWSAAVAIDTSAGSSPPPSIAIDSNDNIFVVYRISTNVVEKELTYSGGSWSVQVSPTTIDSGSTCSTGGCLQTYSVAIQSGNKIVVAVDRGITLSSSSACESFLSSNSGASWSAESEPGINDTATSTPANCSTIAVGADMWFLAIGDSLGDNNTFTVEKDIGTTGTWTSTGTTLTNVDNTLNSVSSSSSGVLDVFYKNTSNNNLEYRQYSISGNSFGSVTTISSVANDVFGSISAGPSSTLFAFYQEYQGSANSYKVAYKKYSGSWGSANYVSSDTTNNTNINSAVNNGATSSNKLGVLWTNGTAAPWTVKGSSVSMNSPPSTPTLTAPGANVTTLTPTFSFNDTDPNADDIQFKINLYQSNCSTPVTSYDMASGQTGWSPTFNGTAASGLTYTSATAGSGVSFTPSSNLSTSTTYCWTVSAKDPGGSNSTTTSATSTFTINLIPAAPTLSLPSNSGAGVSATPIFNLKTTDADNNYLRYKILLCQDSGCSTVLYTWDQTSSQTGWSGQDQQSGTAYTGSSTIGSSTLAVFQPSILLSPNTQYWWEGFAKDPAGSNTWSSASAIWSFTTTPSQMNINGGVNINGGTTIQ